MHRRLGGHYVPIDSGGDNATIGLHDPKFRVYEDTSESPGCLGSPGSDYAMENQTETNLGIWGKRPRSRQDAKKSTIRESGANAYMLGSDSCSTTRATDER